MSMELLALRDCLFQVTTESSNHISKLFLNKYVDVTKRNWCYHMTHTAPRAISLENHKRKGPVWGPYALKWQGRKNEYCPTRQAYDKIDAS